MPMAVRPARTDHLFHKYSLALLAAVMNNPGLHGAVEEDFAGLAAFLPHTARLLHNVVQSSLQNAPAALDTEALRTHLHQAIVEHGLEKEMRDILNDSVYVHAAFARPREKDDGPDLQTQWQEFWRSLKEKSGLRGYEQDMRSDLVRALDSQDHAAAQRVIGRLGTQN